MAGALMRVLVTRPRADAERVAELLRARGHEPVISSLMEIHFFDGPEIDLAGVQAILATSANGIRAVARRTPRRDLPILAVGAQTASAAKAARFLSINTAQGDSHSLADAVCDWATSNGGVLVHVAGREHGGDLARQLSELGFQVRTDVLYRAAPAPSLSQDAIGALCSRTLDAVMLFSPRSARLFGQAVSRANLSDRCKTLAAVYISHHAAEAGAAIEFGKTRVAAQPSLDAMLAAVDELHVRSKTGSLHAD